MRCNRFAIIKPSDSHPGSEGFFVFRKASNRVLTMKIKRKAKITLVLGGTRSGKSSYAKHIVETVCKRPLYIATAEALDAEMSDRIARHRADRGDDWNCIEEPINVAQVLGNLPCRTDGVLLDCMTLWLSNVLMKEGAAGFAKRKKDLLGALRRINSDLVIVSNEVGMGLVPDNKLGREFRDYAGWLNQDIAEIADNVVFVIAGIPLVLKGEKR